MVEDRDTKEAGQLYDLELFGGGANIRIQLSRQKGHEKLVILKWFDAQDNDISVHAMTKRQVEDLIETLDNLKKTGKGVTEVPGGKVFNKDVPASRTVYQREGDKVRVTSDYPKMDVTVTSGVLDQLQDYLHKH